MLKFPPSATRLVRRLLAGMHEVGPAEPPDGASDPFAHPSLRGMTPAQLADLPFDRGPATPRPAPAAHPPRDLRLLPGGCGP